MEGKERRRRQRGPGGGGRRWQGGAGECGTACREWDALKNDVENKKEIKKLRYLNTTIFYGSLKFTCTSPPP